MNHEEFIKILEKSGLGFSIVEGRLKVLNRSHGSNHFNILELENIPAYTDFENDGFVNIPRLTELPESVHFNNGEYVRLERLNKISRGCVFNNLGFVSLPEIFNIPEDTEFNNSGQINIGMFIIYNGFSKKGLGIYNISNKNLFKLMVKRSVFK
jgi:hypothetical protein